MIFRLAALLAAVCSGALAQQYVQVTNGPGALVRGLDKVNGETQDFRLSNGETVTFGSLQIYLSECRYPLGNPAGDAFAELTITDVSGSKDLFSGWMVASSPALNPLDHARYDVWVMRCAT